jgi:hypothetical protein
MARQTSKTACKTKKEVYISLNLDELAALEKLGFRERWAYIAWKKAANFTTGVLGEFDKFDKFGKCRKQKLGYTDIAKLVVPPPGVQGRGEGRIDDTQAKDFISRMEAVGLVCGVGRRGNGGLRFELPMSPINRKKNAMVQTDNPEPHVPISPTESEVENAGKPVEDWDDADAGTTLSVLNSSKEENINTEAVGSSEDDTASSGAFGAHPSRAEGAAALRENPRAVAAGAAPLTAQQIYSTLADSWVITETNTPQAWQLYEAWAGAIHLDDLHAAMISVEERVGGRETTPSDLMPYLMPVIANYQPGQSSA